jgi:hypothetical protein
MALNGRQKRALRRMEKSVAGFQPLANLLNVGEKLAGQLVDLGLAERGECEGIYAKYGIGYKLTDAGWRALNNE